MRKSILFILLFLSIFLLSSCSKKQILQINDNLQFVDVIKYERFGSSNVELLKKFSGEELNELVEQLNIIIYKEIEINHDKEYQWDFKLYFDNKELIVLSSEIFEINENGYFKRYQVIKNDFMFMHDYDFITDNLYNTSNFNFNTLIYVFSEGKELDLSLNTKIKKDFQNHKMIKLYVTKNKNPICSIKFGNVLIDVIEPNLVSIDGFTYMLEFNFDYNILNLDEVLEFEGFNETEKISVIKQENLLTLNLLESDIDSFISSLNDIKFVELYNKNNYNLNNLMYTITLDSCTINVYNDNVFEYNNKLYYALESSFTFLNDLKFNSTGWLPWV